MPTTEAIGLVDDAHTSQADVNNAQPAQDELTFPQILNGISALVSCMTPDGAVETVNGHVLDYFGKTLEELKRWTNTDAIHPEDRPGAIALWKRAVENGEPYDMEARQRGADGVYRWFHVQGLPVRAPEGRIIRWCVLQTDIDERKRAQEAVRESERELRHLIDNIPGFVCVLSATGAVELLNRQLLEYFGKTTEELKDWDTGEAVHPDDLPDVIEAWKQSIETGQPYDRELRQRRADGVYRWFQSRALPSRDTTGRISGWYMLVTDIDDRKRAEEAQRKSEHELRQLVDNVPGMIAVGDANGKSEYVNKRAIDYLDTTHEGFSDRPIQTVHPEDQELLRNEWMRCNTTGQPMDLVHRVRRFDGVYRWVHVRGDPFRDDQGRIVRWYYLFTDIDDQRRAEQALRESERELREIIENVPGMVSVADETGRLIYANKRNLDFTGKTLEEQRGFEGLKLIHPDEQEWVLAEWLRCCTSGQPYELDHRFRRFDGVYRWVHIRVDPFLDDSGRISRWYGLLTDIDDQKRGEEAQRQMEETLRSTRRKLSTAMQIATVAELSASIAHEINQPLASVVTNAQAAEAWLSHDPPNLERAQATLDRIIRDGHSAAEVLKRIRALFKEAAPVKAPLDINRIVAEVLGMLSEELCDKNIVVETELQAVLPMISADHVQIQQTLINLVHNATEAMSGVEDRAKTLALTSQCKKDQVLIEVRDHGFGSKDPTLMFEPFFTTKESGMGMGLSICRS
ncbi:MAG TPA: PAS domain-containing protein, partial [Gemmatimonadaceae bacterium]|nr:PAS domain-containing protein [Gemmatimonadaceae bacterium]